MVEAERREPTPPQEGYMDVPGGKVWYKIVNPNNSKKTPLLLLHGGPGIPSTDLHPLEALASDRPVIFYDQLGCGNSDKPEDTSLWTVERFVEEVAVVRKTLNLRELHLLGYSWGGTLAMEYLLTHGQEGIKSLILASPMLSNSRVTKDIERMINEIEPGAYDKMVELEKEGKMEDEYYKRIKIIHDHKHSYGEGLDINNLPQKIQESDEKTGIQVFTTMVGSVLKPTGVLSTYERVDRLGELTIPVLYTVGRMDEITPESVDWFSKNTPGSKVETFEQSAHMPQFTEQQKYINAVRNFLS